MASNDDNTGRNFALAAGGGALIWLLLRGGRGFGLGGGGIGPGKGASGATTETATPIVVRLGVPGWPDDDTHIITVDGQPTDLAGTVAAARARGAADVSVSGAARQGTAEELLSALRASGARIGVGS